MSRITLSLRKAGRQYNTYNLPPPRLTFNWQKAVPVPDAVGSRKWVSPTIRASQHSINPGTVTPGITLPKPTKIVGSIDSSGVSAPSQRQLNVTLTTPARLIVSDTRHKR